MSAIKKIVYVVGVTIFVLLSSYSLAQSRRSQKFLTKALEYYQSYQLDIAEEFAIQSVSSDSTNIEAYKLLADIYNRKNKTDEEIDALQHIVNSGKNSNALAHKLLIKKLMEVGRYTDALLYIREFQHVAPQSDSAWVQSSKKYCLEAESILQNLLDVDIVPLDSSINTDTDEYWPFISADDSILYFTRLIKDENSFPFERIMTSKRTPFDWSKPRALTINADKQINQGTISITAAHDILFFTVCGSPAGKGSCDIFYITKTNQKWSKPQNALSINTASWDAQPAVSVYGDKLFWASNRQGGMGAKDIWYCTVERQSKGNLIFGEPVNAGPGINTAKNDYSPFIHADNQTLYFASDGHVCIGGADMFISRFEHSQWTKAQNLGYPVNSFADDDGLVVMTTAKAAFFSSARERSFNGSKDLYTLKLPSEYKPADTGYLKGFVFDAKTNEKIDAHIELSKLNSNINHSIKSTYCDGYIAILKKGESYAFNIAQKGYMFYSAHFDYTQSTDFHDARIMNIYLNPISSNDYIELENVFFEHDSYVLDEKSKAELNQIILFLTLNKNMKVEIEGHTDNTGSKDYNQVLSEKRAKAICEYLSGTILNSRISYKGYGSEKPVATNSTPQGRSKNRRSEMRILSVD